MTSIRTRGEQVRSFILESIEDNPSDLVAMAAAKFGITRQAIHKHLRRLVDEGVVEKRGATRNLTYHLKPTGKWTKAYAITPSLAEDVVLREDVAPELGRLPDNVARIWDYGFTEMFNNAIDHSDGSEIRIFVTKTAAATRAMIQDDGVGIFGKIQRELGLLDERHAVLELSKGKLTTDPENHTGEGIFFTSRMFDRFAIVSGGTLFSHEYGDQEDWILEHEQESSGTSVFMELNNHTSRTAESVFSQFTSGDDFGFTKTVVPVKLARYGNENLVSRSQAKRLLARVDRFRTVLFDFTDVEQIGQAFADEIFRVFQNQHPSMELVPIHTNEAVSAMIRRATQRG